MPRAARRILGLFFLAVAAVLHAQTFDATRIGQPADLEHAPWRFAVGDDLRWSDPALDDSQWQPLRFDLPLSRQGHPHYSGPWWYRLHVQVPPGANHLAIALDSWEYQLYINGTLLAQAGGYPNHPVFSQDILQVIPIPDALASSGTLVIAVRESIPAMMGKNDLGADRHLRLGDLDQLTAFRQADRTETIFNALGGLVVGVITLIIGLWALGLFRSQPAHREYLWLGVMALAFMAYEAANLLTNLLPWPIFALFIPLLSIASCISVGYVLFVCAMLAVPISWPIRLYCVLCCLPPLIALAVLAGWVGNLATNVTYMIIRTPIDIFAPLLAFRQYRRGHKEAGVLLVPLLLQAAADYALIVGSILQLLQIRRPGPPSLIPELHLGPVPLQPGDISLLLFTLTIGAIMLNRSIRITREQQRAAAELEAARTVQALLLGREASAPGYRVESAYLPAQEVGGDFFQTVAGADGSLLVVIGDVAGKGLQAAMRVSMIVGAIRLMDDLRPGVVLGKLNHVLLGQGGEGFTTCLAARCCPDGTMTVANAGHLAPWRNGAELPLDGNLPLGVSPDADYTEQSFSLAPDDRLLFLSDGVVEARNNKGELYSFERLATSAGAIRLASALAEDARTFGQEDDITVLLLERMPVLQLAPA